MRVQSPSNSGLLHGDESDVRGQPVVLFRRKDISNNKTRRTSSLTFYEVADLASSRHHIKCSRVQPISFLLYPVGISAFQGTFTPQSDRCYAYKEAQAFTKPAAPCSTLGDLAMSGSVRHGLPRDGHGSHAPWKQSIIRQEGTPEHPFQQLDVSFSRLCRQCNANWHAVGLVVCGPCGTKNYEAESWVGLYLGPHSLADISRCIIGILYSRLLEYEFIRTCPRE
jgi:hypothetical protein